jgi:hypothetical protein
MRRRRRKVKPEEEKEGRRTEINVGRKERRSIMERGVRRDFRENFEERKRRRYSIRKKTEIESSIRVREITERGGRVGIVRMA